jgi:DNA-binding response OmpR family regulator
VFSFDYIIIGDTKVIMNAPSTIHLSRGGRQQPKVLIVDDNEDTVKLLRLTLEKAGMAVISANTGLEAIRANYSHRPDLILLDLMMPEMDGYTTTQRLREISDVPILILSAKAQTVDITKAFELGADDYVSKPYDCWELVARIQAAIRRIGSVANDEDEIISLGNGDFVIDLARHRVLIQEREVKLTRTEFELLVYLARNRGRVLKHNMILEEVWGHDTGVGKDTLKQFVLSLRKKIEEDPGEPRWIINEHGVGYSLAPE